MTHLLTIAANVFRRIFVQKNDILNICLCFCDQKQEAQLSYDPRVVEYFR